MKSVVVRFTVIFISIAVINWSLICISATKIERNPWLKGRLMQIGEMIAKYSSENSHEGKLENSPTWDSNGKFG